MTRWNPTDAEMGKLQDQQIAGLGAELQEAYSRLGEFPELDLSRSSASRSGAETGEGESSGVGLLPAQPIALIPHRPDPEIRSILERAMADYDSGRLTGLAVIKLFADTDACESDWHGKRWELLTGATRIAHRMQRALDEITDGGGE